MLATYPHTELMSPPTALSLTVIWFRPLSQNTTRTMTKSAIAMAADLLTHLVAAVSTLTYFAVMKTTTMHINQ